MHLQHLLSIDPASPGRRFGHFAQLSGVSSKAQSGWQVSYRCGNVVHPVMVAVQSQARRSENMKKNVLIIALSLALTSLLSAATIPFVVAQDTPAVDTKPYLITVSVGQAVNICTTGTVICPVRFTMCADNSIATIREGDNGPEIVGVKPGTTLCYTTSANAVRFVYEVTVR
jgi:hypothetical protein